MANCCNADNGIKDINRSQRLTNQARRKATRIAQAHVKSGKPIKKSTTARTPKPAHCSGCKGRK